MAKADIQEEGNSGVTDSIQADSGEVGIAEKSPRQMYEREDCIVRHLGKTKRRSAFSEILRIPKKR